MKRDKSHFQGCLIGGAIGDALGWPIEFKKSEQIKTIYGSSGIQELQLDEWGCSQITDDTQMTLFTAEGILRAECRGINKGICHPPTVIYYAYQRWLITQGGKAYSDYDWIYDGILLDQKQLYASRAPGNTCITALEDHLQGAMDRPVNNSKGCGGVMRVAPVGLFYSRSQAFQMGAEVAAITHGHPSGYLAAGALASIIAAIVDGQKLKQSIFSAIDELKEYENHSECVNALSNAVQLSESDVNSHDAIHSLGQGWVAEEALAISVYCALKYSGDFRAALIAAVNHDGDSDSTGAITGNILGAYLGIEAIPDLWIKQVELSGLILEIADDLITGYEDSDDWWNKYPGY